MATVTVYLRKEDEQYVDKFKAIEDKATWIKKHLDTDVQQEVVVAPTTPNVPRPDFVSVVQWNTWLRDNGFDVEV